MPINLQVLHMTNLAKMALLISLLPIQDFFFFFLVWGGRSMKKDRRATKGRVCTYSRIILLDWRVFYSFLVRGWGEN